MSMDNIIQIRSLICGKGGRFYAVGKEGTLYNIKLISDVWCTEDGKGCYVADQSGNTYMLKEK